MPKAVPLYCNSCVRLDLNNRAGTLFLYLQIALIDSIIDCSVNLGKISFQKQPHHVLFALSNTGDEHESRPLCQRHDTDLEATAISGDGRGLQWRILHYLHPRCHRYLERQSSSRNRRGNFYAQLPSHSLEAIQRRDGKSSFTCCRGHPPSQRPSMLTLVTRSLTPWSLRLTVLAFSATPAPCQSSWHRRCSIPRI